MNQHRVYEPHIFLCHASEDKPLVQELYHQLKGARYHPWLDKEDLLPGQDWWREIERIIRDPYNLIAVFLSSKSITKRGGAFVNYEWGPPLCLPRRYRPELPRQESRVSGVHRATAGLDCIQRALWGDAEDLQAQPT